ncbi:TPA: hypothetical protein N0F65_004572 [Lagenidium giganteum]|uniref:Peptidase S54 rhomboid domain-containing protein n=1 Tax=Lagenidium giganteum TaxID=4803 RepID=A0AAV2ZF90_9STRA|nr:TPA: hypothetical protein N0F65_004572 [Lagenidium giganteum]
MVHAVAALRAAMASTHTLRVMAPKHGLHILPLPAGARGAMMSTATRRGMGIIHSRVPNALQPAQSRTSTKASGAMRMQVQRFQRQQQYHGRGGQFEISGDKLVWSLIAINAGVTFLWQTADTPAKRHRMVAFFTTSASHLHNGLYHTLLTSVFSHADIGHLLTNMVGLFFFGREICYVLGPKRFLGLYLGSGILSSWAAVQEQKMAHRRATLNLGASGAVNSITAISVLLFPHSTFLIFGVLPMPAWLAGSMFIGKDFYSWITNQRDGIGHFAHLSGAFCGAAYYFYLRKSLLATLHGQRVPLSRWRLDTPLHPSTHQRVHSSGSGVHLARQSSTTAGRSYYGGSVNWKTTAGRFIYGMIGANLVVAGLWNWETEDDQKDLFMLRFFSTSPLHLANHDYCSLITSRFSHVRLDQLAVNMFGLYVFGRELGFLLGPKRVLTLYAGTSVVSSLISIIYQEVEETTTISVGADGPVTALAMLTLTLVPHTQARFFRNHLSIPMWLVGGLFLYRDELMDALMRVVDPSYQDHDSHHHHHHHEADDDEAVPMSTGIDEETALAEQERLANVVGAFCGVFYYLHLSRVLPGIRLR